jgi:hypothetical protein
VCPSVYKKLTPSVFATYSNDLVLFEVKMESKIVQISLFASNSNVLALSGGQNCLKMWLLEHPECHFRNTYMHSDAFWESKWDQKSSKFQFLQHIHAFWHFSRSKWCFPGTRNSLFATYTCIQALFEVKMESKIVKNSILEVNICNPMLFGCQSGVRSVTCQFVYTLSILP